MKLKNYFFAALALCAFASCSNDDEPQNPDNNQSAVLAITVIGENATKAATDLGTREENNITSLSVYVYDTSGNLIDKKQLNELGTAYFDKGLFAGNQYKVDVIANYAEDDYATAEVDLAAAAAENNFIMSGSATTRTLVASQDETNIPDVNKITVPIARIASKLNFSTIQTQWDSESSTNATSFILEEATIAPLASKSKVYNGNNESPVFIEDQGSQEKFTATYNQIVENSPVPVNLGGYVLSTNNSVVLTIKGKVCHAGTDVKTDVEYSYQIGEIARNTIYDIQAKVVGDRTEELKANLLVTITVDNWKTVTLTPELQ